MSRPRNEPSEMATVLGPHVPKRKRGRPLGSGAPKPTGWAALSEPQQRALVWAMGHDGRVDAGANTDAYAGARFQSSILESLGRRGLLSLGYRGDPTARGLTRLSGHLTAAGRRLVTSVIEDAANDSQQWSGAT